MAWTQTDLEGIEAAIAGGAGARTITFADQSVTFSTIDEMLKLRAVMQQELGTARRYRVVSTDKGV